MRRALLPLLLAACASAPAAEDADARQETPAAAPADPALAEAEDRLELERQYAAVAYERHLAYARRYRDRLETEEALAQVALALRHRPAGEEALRLRDDLQRDLGLRAGETRTVLRDAWEERQARQQERVVTIRRKLAEAERRLAAGDLEEARRAYEAAAFVLELARRDPLHDAAELDALQERLRAGVEAPR